MISFTKPKNLNGAELLEELAAADVTVTDRPSDDGEGLLWLDIAEADKDKAAPIVAAHNGTMIAPNNSAAKAALLANLGITADEFKTLLGGN